MSEPVPATSAGVPVGRLVRLTALGALVGIPIGLFAYAFIWVVHELTHLLWHDLPAALGMEHPPSYLVVGLPVIGGLLVYLARLLPGDGGHSPNHVGIALGGRPSEALGVILASVATLAFGMVLGPEAPLLVAGAALAVGLTGWAKLDSTDQSLVGASGASAALSTLFGGPLVAGLMLMESSAGAGLAMIPILLPALGAASVSSLLITGLGAWSGLPILSLVVGDLPAYTSVLIGDLVAAVVVGVVMSVVALGLRRLATAVEGLETVIGRLPLLLGGGLAVGLLAWGAGLLGAQPVDVLFSGQTSIAPLLQTTGGTALALAVAKALAYVVSLGSGFRGGAIFPAVFLGVAVADLAVLTLGMSPTVAVAIGTAAGMAAMTRYLITSVLFAGLLVGRAGLDTIPVATVAAAATWLASAALDHLSASRPSSPAASRPA